MTTVVEQGLAAIDATARGLTELRDWLTQHPDAEGHMFGTVYILHGSTGDPADLVRLITAGAPLGSVTKKASPSTPGILFVERKFSGGVRIQYQAPRDEVCTRRVVGVETVEVPDPAAPLVTIEREIVEWDCQPILGGAA